MISEVRIKLRSTIFNLTHFTSPQPLSLRRGAYHSDYQGDKPPLLLKEKGKEDEVK